MAEKTFINHLRAQYDNQLSRNMNKNKVKLGLLVVRLFKCSWINIWNAIIAFWRQWRVFQPK